MVVKKLICILITILILMLPFSINTFAALPVYNAQKDFSTKQGSVWKYQAGYNNGGYYGFTDLTCTDGTWGSMNLGVINRTDDDMVLNQPAIFMHSGANSDPVLTFVAPYSGTIEITMTGGGVYCPLNGKEQNFDGINFYMCCGSTKVAAFEGVSSENSKAGNKVFDKTYTVEIVKGECIYFIVQPNKNTNNDKVTFNPEIVYTALSNKAEKKATVPAYIGNRATSAPSSGNQPAIPSNITGTAKDGVYRITQEYGPDMENWQFFWENANVQYEMTHHEGVYNFKGAAHATVSASGTRWHPHIAGFNILTFTCPESGRVRIGSECTMSVVETTVDGVNIKVISERNILGDTYLLDAKNPSQEFKPIEFDVYKGQKISFYLDMNLGNAGDSTTFAPYVKYLEYKEVAKYDKGNYQEYIPPKEDGERRTDMDPVISTEEENTIDIAQILIGAGVVMVIAIIVVAIVLIIRRRNHE